MVDRAVEGIRKLLEESQFRRKNNLSERRLLYETLENDHLKSKGLNAKNYALVVVEPAPKLRKAL